jgi:FKBP-type peptidyl-prolyl cis-trans isomerase FklB
MRTVLSAILGTVLFLGAGVSAEPPELDDPADRAGYSLGHQIGKDLKRQGSEIDPEALRRGLLDGLAGADPAFDPGDMQQILSKLKTRLMAAQRNDDRETAERHREAGKEFLAANAKKEGVVMRPSGLQYKVLRPGTGRTPGPGDKVTVHYRGTTLDGHRFYDSYGKGEPATFHVSGVTRGLTEAFQLMKEGARWELFLPPDLAYGRRGPLAHHAVIFDVELIAVVPGG